MASKISLEQCSSSTPTPSPKHQKFLDLKNQLNALHATKEAPADTDEWDWNATTPVTPEHKACIVEFFGQKQSPKTEAEDDSFL